METTETKILPFMEYIDEDKSIYPYASETIDERTGKPFIDADNDFRVGNSGGFLMDIDFTFIDTHLFSEVAETYERNKKDPEIV